MSLLKRILLLLCGVKRFGIIPPNGFACSHNLLIENKNGDVVEIWIKPFKNRRKENNNEPR